MPKKQSNPPRRKAKQARSRETIDVVIEAAARVLLREGYARASTNRIAETAGVSVGTIYQYFADKDEIFDALLQREANRVVEALASVVPDPELSLEQTLRGMLSLGVELQPNGPELYHYLEYMPNGLFRRRITAINRKLAHFVRQLLEPHRDRLRVDNLDLASFIVVHTAEGIGFNATRQMFADGLVDDVTDLLLRYLVHDPV
ncbi:MAG: TetR/AcrR family transcriptional regulator [Deltaproteobacteria bacterium]|nr:TetR/AcrR family transcriptional regulator [Deltaproteobacteria bacterium]MBW2390146.1 TetR/AcrR family transcriptional regulator [Deltaproteobacteria bacterium]MBW2726293.1 TetR/AcrR family transcriptional regulator [Deltaproteobacteria bacterium]